MLSIPFSVEVVPAANSAGLSQEVRDITVTGPAANSAGPAVVRGVTANSFGPATSSQFYKAANSAVFIAWSGGFGIVL